MPTKKYKRLTQKEKALNKKIRQELISEGVIPPPKPKLNRKRYIEEAESEWNKKEGYDHEFYLFMMNAFSIVLGHTDKNFKVSSEAIGAAKVLKLTIRLKEFHEKMESEGRTQYTIGEKYEFIKDILKA